MHMAISLNHWLKDWEVKRFNAIMQELQLRPYSLPSEYVMNVKNAYVPHALTSAEFDQIISDLHNPRLFNDDHTLSNGYSL